MKMLMTHDYNVRAQIAYNLTDALEELSHIIEMFGPEAEIDEDGFRARMAHLYWHLNTAWNMRNVSGDEFQLAGKGQLNAWGQFPGDLEPL
jgi:hypothetical protein